MFRVMIDSLLGFHHSRSAERLLTRIQIPIEAREIAAGDVDADAMRGFEDIARRPQINRVFMDLARLNRLSFFGRVAKARANDAVAQVARIACRIDVNDPPVEGWACPGPGGPHP